MQLEDFPISAIGDLERRLTDNAGHEQTMGDEAERTNHPSAGYYRAALAYCEAARQVSQTGQVMIAHLDRLAAAEQQPVHPWPIPRLENLTYVHRGDDIPTTDSDTWGQRYPRWGVETDDRGEAARSNIITAQPDAFGDGVILTVSSGLGEHHAPEREIVMNLDYAQWDALVALVARQRAGKPTPYDTVGNIRAQETARCPE